MGEKEVTTTVKRIGQCSEPRCQSICGKLNYQADRYPEKELCGTLVEI